LDFAGRPIATWFRRGALDWSLAHYLVGQDEEFHEHAQAQVHFLLCGSFAEYWPDSTHAAVGPFIGVLPGGMPHRNAWGESGALILTAHLSARSAARAWCGWRRTEGVQSPLEIANAVERPADLVDYLDQTPVLPRKHIANEAALISLAQIGSGAGPISGLARASGKSASAYSKSIKREIGVSPDRVRLEGQLARAVEKILRTGASFAVIAQACGFSDQAHLTRMMRRRTGMTPGELRRSMRGAE
jgi:AraC-like DNA-binding protein